MSITLVTLVVTTNTLCQVFWVIYGVAFVSHMQEKKKVWFTIKQQPFEETLPSVRISKIPLLRTLRIMYVSHRISPFFSYICFFLY